MAASGYTDKNRFIFPYPCRWPQAIIRVYPWSFFYLRLGYLFLNVLRWASTAAFSSSILAPSMA